MFRIRVFSHCFGLLTDENREYLWPFFYHYIFSTFLLRHRWRHLDTGLDTIYPFWYENPATFAASNNESSGLTARGEINFRTDLHEF